MEQPQGPSAPQVPAASSPAWRERAPTFPSNLARQTAKAMDQGAAALQFRLSRQDHDVGLARLESEWRDANQCGSIYQYADRNRSGSCSIPAKRAGNCPEVRRSADLRTNRRGPQEFAALQGE